MSIMKIKDLPPSTIRQLCRYLNTEGNGVRNWRDLVAHAPGNVYDAIHDIHTFSRAGQRIDTSPAEEVITDFIALGFTVDILYRILFKMDAVQCMELLITYVSAPVIAEIEEARQERERTRYIISHPSGDRNPSPDLHPEYGPLPDHPPPTAASQSHDNRPHLPANQSSADARQNGVRSRYGVSPKPGEISLSPRMRPHQLISSSSWTGSGSSSSDNVFPSSAYSDFSFSDQTLPVTTPTLSSVDTYPSTHPTPTPTRNVTGSPSSHIPPLSHPPNAQGYPTPNILHFGYSELSDVTEDFTEDIIGMGTFGTVFRARIRGNGPFAIKKLHSESEMGGDMFYDTIHRETFSQELQMLTRYNYRNILSLVAYSNDGPMPCLVYEYMENGSLAECLAGKRNVVLSWQLRVDIAKQIADALHFLHTVNLPTCLVHGDVKSANILLDANFVPKLSDFGLARELKRKPNERSTYSTKSDVVMGTMAYMAPEFLRNKKFTPHSDVYSFGVVLLEMYTGQPALSSDIRQKNRVLTDRLAILIDDSEHHKEEVVQVADPSAGWPHQNALELFDIATVCLRHKHKQRPGMDQVLDQLRMVAPS